MPKILTYHLTHACGTEFGWRPRCTNSFRVATKERVKASGTAPTTICLKPVLDPKCTICDAIIAIGVQNLVFSGDFSNGPFFGPFPDNWTGSFGVAANETNQCVWTGYLPKREEAETTYFQPAACSNPLTGKWVTEGQLSLSLTGEIGFQWSLDLEITTYFMVTVNPENPACLVDVGSRIDVETNSHRLGFYGRSGVDCHETFSFDQTWPEGSDSAITIELPPEQ